MDDPRWTLILQERERLHAYVGDVSAQDKVDYCLSLTSLKISKTFVNFVAIESIGGHMVESGWRYRAY